MIKRRHIPSFSKSIRNAVARAWIYIIIYNKINTTPMCNDLIEKRHSTNNTPYSREEKKKLRQKKRENKTQRILMRFKAL